MERGAEPPPVVVLPEPPEGAPVDPIASLKITAIMGEGERGLVALNGRVFRMGSEVAIGWSVSKIDAGAWLVELAGPRGETRTIKRGE